METLSDSKWDIVISGTGLPQSLLALALSRSGKKVLHVDHNNYYGGPDAALSLQDAECWIESINNGVSTFRDAKISTPRGSGTSSNPTSAAAELGFSRAYSLCLSPQVIYTRSALLPTLVSSRVYRQLEFLAVGSWWIYKEPQKINNEDSALSSARSHGKLKKIPGSREDVFGDKSIDLKSKRSLMKFLKMAADAENHPAILKEWGEKSFHQFLTLLYAIPAHLQDAVHALTLSPKPPENTKTSYALPRIARHLTSIGVFGPGFGSVIPKWGGVAEIAQVSCRAGAVGGGVYVLGQGIVDLKHGNCDDKESKPDFIIQLQTGDTVRSQWVVGCYNDFPSPTSRDGVSDQNYTARSVTIVSSSLSSLFPNIADGAPPPAVAVVVFPIGSFETSSLSQPSQRPPFPVYLMIHSSETGECPSGQSVIYSSIQTAGSQAYSYLDIAVRNLLDAVGEPPRPEILWTLQYSQMNDPPERSILMSDIATSESLSHKILFSNSSGDLAFDEKVLCEVQEAWKQVSGESEGFMLFEDREVGAYDDDDA